MKYFPPLIEVVSFNLNSFDIPHPPCLIVSQQNIILKFRIYIFSNKSNIAEYFKEQMTEISKTTMIDILIRVKISVTSPYDKNVPVNHFRIKPLLQLEISQTTMIDIKIGVKNQCQQNVRLKCPCQSFKGKTSDLVRSQTLSIYVYDPNLPNNLRR